MFGLLLIIVFIYCIVQNAFTLPYVSIFKKSFVVKSNKFNMVTSLEFKNKPYLKTIEIHDQCFRSVKTFYINGVIRLQKLKIGQNSFTQITYGSGQDRSKSFHILNCESLESIEIGEWSFYDFAGEFELKNLPALQSIQIGTVGSNSYNFYWNSFVIGGILNDIEYVMIRSS